MASICMTDLSNGMSAVKVVAKCLEMLENDEKFNAGIGSALQSDGLPRLTSSIMDGSKQNFSGVVSVPYLTNPSKLAELQELEHWKAKFDVAGAAAIEGYFSRRWVAEHIRTAILKFNFEIDKLEKLLVKDFTDE